MVNEKKRQTKTNQGMPIGGHTHKKGEMQSSGEEGDGDEIGIGMHIGFGVGSEVCSALALGSGHARDETRGRKGEVECAA